MLYRTMEPAAVSSAGFAPGYGALASVYNSREQRRTRRRCIVQGDVMAGAKLSGILNSAC